MRAAITPEANICTATETSWRYYTKVRARSQASTLECAHPPGDAATAHLQFVGGVIKNISRWKYVISYTVRAAISDKTKKSKLKLKWQLLLGDSWSTTEAYPRPHETNWAAHVRKYFHRETHRSAGMKTGSKAEQHGHYVLKDIRCNYTCICSQAVLWPKYSSFRWRKYIKKMRHLPR